MFGSGLGLVLKHRPALPHVSRLPTGRPECSHYSGNGKLLPARAWMNSNADPAGQRGVPFNGLDLRAGGGAGVHVLVGEPHCRSISAQAEEPSWNYLDGGLSVVDLRAGGGTQDPTFGRCRNWGRSPRRRRNQLRPAAIEARVGSISAQAENPDPRCSRPPPAWVHLRGGGGAGDIIEATGQATGRSPRGWRNPVPTRAQASQVGSISTRVEEPLRTYSL
jgi:hypothetical protein